MLARVWSILGVVVLCAVANARELGYPPIAFFRQEQHGGGAQTFWAENDPQGRLVFGNLDGVLIHDGAWWRRLDVPDGTAFRTHTAPDGTLAVAALQDIGLFDPNAAGPVAYRSLKPFLPKRLRDNLTQAEVCHDSRGRLIFATQHWVTRWTGQSMQILADTPENTWPVRCWNDGEKAWLGGYGRTWNIDEPDRIRFAGKRLDAMLKEVVIVRGEGLFTPDERVIDTDASQWLRGKTVMDAHKLRDGRIAVATLRFGLLILARDLRIDRIIDAKAGLPEDLMYSVTQDNDGALWLAMDNVIARIDVETPLTVLDSRIGIRGGIHAVTRHRDTLTVATSHGVFYVHPGEPAAVAERIDAIQDVPWALVSSHDDLLVGVYRGIVVIHDRVASPKLPGSEDLLIYSMRASRRDPSLIWVGTDEGIARVRRVGNEWKFEPPIAGTGTYVRWFEEEGDVLWSGGDTDGITRIDANGKVQRFGSGEIEVMRPAGRLLFLSADGFRQLDAKGNLIPDPLLGNRPRPGRVNTSGTDRAGNIWVGSRPPRIIRRGADGQYAAQEQAVGMIDGDLEAYFAEDDGVMWAGSERGLYRVAGTPPSSQSRRAPLLHRVVANGDHVVVDGLVSVKSGIELPHDFGRLRIEVAPLSYSAGTLFQYRLDPSDEDWTAWTPQAFLDFTTLAPGNYSFRVRTRSGAGTISDEGNWSFVVLPPWYRTWWAHLLWVAIAAAIVGIIVLLRTRTLQHQAQRLKGRVDEQTVVLRNMVEQLRDAKEALVDKNALLEVSNIRLEQANERLEKLSLLDPLTGLSNRRYFDQALIDEWARAQRRKEPLSLLILDLDHFKALNDSLGHTAGDECLRNVARFLEGVIRGSGDVVARWGGEEFAILLPGTDEASATLVAERLRAGIEPFGVTTSIGVATSPQVADAAQLIEHADRALYAAKNAGRNRVEVAVGATWSTSPDPPMSN